MVESVGRIFVAVGFPPEVRLAIADHLSHVPLPGAVVPAENLHVTLRFLGGLIQVELDRLLAELDQAVLPKPFPVVLDGLGAFPKPRKSSVLWLGISHGSDDLDALQLAVEDSCEEAGLGREERPFRPHVTVSRMRPPVDVRTLIDETPALHVSTRVASIVVLRSHLGGGTPRYEPLEHFTL